MATSDSGGAMSGGKDAGRRSKGCAAGRSSPSESVEVSSPPPATRFVCEAGRPCEACLRYNSDKGKAKGEEAKKAADGSDGGGHSGGSSSSGDSEKLSSECKTNPSSSGGSPSMSISEMHEGVETKGWGSVDHTTDLRCNHGKCPRRLTCWDGKNIGRRYFGCPQRGKENRCDFVHWVDDKWPPMFQKVAASIWEVVHKYKKQAEDAKVDLYATLQNRNEICLEKEALLEEKADLIREKEAIRGCKQALERELALRTRLSRTTCEALQNRIVSEVNDKKMLYGLILSLCGVLVAALLAVVAKK